jgi:hypothetical protein
MKRSLIRDFGIAEDAIIIDPHARHTTTNIRNAARLIFRYGIPADRPALITTQQYHLDSVDSIAFDDPQCPRARVPSVPVEATPVTFRARVAAERHVAARRSARPAGSVGFTGERGGAVSKAARLMMLNANPSEFLASEIPPECSTMRSPDFGLTIRPG